MTKSDIARRVCAGCALLLGLTHLGLSFLIYPALSLDALWFVGAGLAIIVTALGNLSDSPASRPGMILQTLQNAALLAYFIAVWTVFPGIQVIIGAALFAALTLLVLPRTPTSTNPVRGSRNFL